LVVGYIGFASADSLISGLDSLEKIVQLLMGVVGVTLVLLMYYRRRKEKDIMGLLKRTFRVK
jgi:RsiW-degrading membrane proteinase PrsW (M82 family)